MPTKKQILWWGIGVGLLVVLLIVFGLYFILPQQKNLDISINEYVQELKKINNFQEMELALDNPLNVDQIKFLVEQNFVTTATTEKFYNSDPQAYANRNDDWTYLYGEIGGTGDPCARKQSNAVFISSDFLLHIYHLLFDEELKYLEITQLAPKLFQLTESLFAASVTAAQNETDPAQKQSWERLSAFLAVALSEWNGTWMETGEYGRTPAGVYVTEVAPTEAQTRLTNELCPQMMETACDLAQQELALVQAGQGFQMSPIFSDPNQLVDYTQFLPRGHYGENAILQAYFRAMMWFGRSNFLLNGQDEEINQRQTRDALNLAELVKTTGNNDLYAQLSVPIDYLVGENDDLSVAEYQAALAGQPVTTQTIEAVSPQLLAQSKQQIMSSVVAAPDVFDQTKEETQAQTIGFHFLSQKFTPDALILSDLTQGNELPDPETGESLPSLPTAKMVPAVMGDQMAWDELEMMMAPGGSYADSAQILTKKMNELSVYFESWTQTDWQKNNYTRWLDTLNSVEKTSWVQTAFASPYWQQKNLNTYLGSYTELKHDTLLYAKQSYAEMGGGAEECELPAVPLGYVEPNIEFLTKLREMVTANIETLTGVGVIEEDSRVAGVFGSFGETLEFYTRVAQAEIDGEPISEEDFEELRTSAGNLNSLLYPYFEIEKKEEDARSALIADIFTDAADGLILYEANAIPEQILVIVDDVNGRRITRGLVYDYSEFTDGIARGRWTDEEWQAQVYH